MAVVPIPEVTELEVMLDELRQVDYQLHVQVLTETLLIRLLARTILRNKAA